MKQLTPIALLACCLLTACSAMSGKTTGQQVVVHISLYSYPVFTDSFDKVYPVTNETRLKRLIAGKRYLDVKLDMSRGLPVSSFSKQEEKDAELVATLQSKHETHVWDDRYLDFLPTCFFNRVGWIDWYLVRRDSAGKLILLQGEHRWGPFGKFNLIRSAKPGDQIIGGWGC